MVARSLRYWLNKIGSNPDDEVLDMKIYFVNDLKRKLQRDLDFAIKHKQTEIAVYISGLQSNLI